MCWGAAFGSSTESEIMICIVMCNAFHGLSAVFHSFPEPKIMICIVICSVFHVLGCCSRLLTTTWNHDVHCYLQCMFCFEVLFSAPPRNLKSWFALLFAMHFMFWRAVLGAWTWNHDLHCILQCISRFGVLFSAPPQNLKIWFALLFAMHFMF